MSLTACTSIDDLWWEFAQSNPTCSHQELCEHVNRYRNGEAMRWIERRYEAQRKSREAANAYYQKLISG